MYLYLKQKVFSIVEKFNFFDENQNVVYSAKGSFFQIPKSFTLFKDDEPVFKIERKIFSFMPQFRFFSLPSGADAGYIRGKFSLHKNFDIFTPEGDFKIEGSLLGYTFKITDTVGNVLTDVSKQYFTWGDTYKIQIDETRISPETACGAIIAFDNVIHNGGGNN
ncbi:MAG: LURP-one-related family protein [Clostridiales bacterium]|jgi:uncharacterized protein YxjI|nr:LURP-one-related family protein [Clostridiales bacterium]